MLISLLLLPKFTFSQIIDNFSDGDFTRNPAWTGDVNYFLVNKQFQLQSNGPNLANQIISLSTASDFSLNTSWTFFLQLNFDPTATNYVRIYLTSDQEDLKGALNGYFVQIGEAGSTDAFNLYRQKGTATTRIIAGPQKNRAQANVVKAKIKVTRNAAGNWQLFTDTDDGRQYQLEGAVQDNTFISSKFMGVYCRYATASRYNQFIFGDFYIDELVPDLAPPKLTAVKVIDSLNLEAHFSKPPDEHSALSILNYTLSKGYGSPVEILKGNVSTIYQIRYLIPFESGHYTFSAYRIRDKKQQEADSSAIEFFYVKPYRTQYGDLVINEIMANPTGSPGLPQKKFVEIWNTTDRYILTNGFKFSNPTTQGTLGADTLKPKEYLILCAKADTSLFKPYGKTLGLSPWPAVNISKDVLTLSNAEGTILNQVNYADSWYQDALKKKGGYSLELIDPESYCRGMQNWAGSNHTAGGTPGRENSIYRTQVSSTAPHLLSAAVTDSVTIQLKFSKPIDSLSLTNTANYRINNGIGQPLQALAGAPLFETVNLKYKAVLPTGMESELKVSNLHDCAGNLIDEKGSTAKIFIAKKPVKNDLLISEVLFNPKNKGADFVEVYNATGHVLDLKDLQLANVNTTGNTANVKVVSTQSVLIQPGSYWVLTNNPANIKENYDVQNPEHFVQLSSMPAYANTKGSVILLSNGVQIDRFDYTEKMHMALLKDAHGVSLERVSFERPTNEAGNFKSAAASAGFATPTYANSQTLVHGADYVQLLSKTFSPDLDGFEDELLVDYQFNGGVALATINIYTDKGVLVRRLLKNQSIAHKGRFSWDGLNDGGQLCRPGIYVLVFDVFDLNGKTKRYKNACVLAVKLN